MSPRLATHPDSIATDVPGSDAASLGDRPLRVLHCLWKGEIGGVERAVYQLVREQLRDPSLTPALLFAQGGGLYHDYARQLGCPVIDLGLPHGHALGRVRAAASAMRRFDVHHFHSAEPVLMLASAMCRNALRVYTHRGGITDYPLRSRIRHALAGFLIRRFFHAFSGNTAHAARCASALYGVAEERIRVTYNGVDTALLVPRRPAGVVRDELELGADDFVLGTAANLKRWKRVERLLEAVVALREPTLRLLVVGDGPDRPRLEALASELGLDSRVVFAGLRPHVADYLQAMDAFCLPSTGLESFGNAAVEAMALGLPTIVFADGGGLVEHIEPDETGFVVADQAELEKALRRLLAEPGRGRELGTRARARVRERYTLERAARAYRALYAAAETRREP